MPFEPQDRAGNDSYLWDGSGQPNPETLRLEQALGRFRQSGPAPPFPAIELPARQRRWWSEMASNAWTPRFAAAILVISAIGCGLWLAQSPKTLSVGHSGWSVEITSTSQPSENGDVP